MLILTLMWTLSIMIMFLNHPLSLGMILLGQTILTSMITGMLNLNYWFSYILFLIMIGGMLILFIYMTSIASNEKFKFSYKLTFMLFLLMSISLVFLIMDYLYFNLKMNLMDMMNQNNFNDFKLSMNKYMNYPHNLILFMMIMYLLITLIMVVKITNIHYGPLRQKY
uniref:NADH-ubiquinone oxidoreductase chain 6 n=1 Tax=Chrysomela vigintipunctata TaxID=153828 RepID=A0A7L7S6D2_CHRVG|nr:NADH dehydrogenase subunit 6 [Chrysomela vigintipunctata]QNV48738.1 NADH dehydrogenase subunit 6 [Chrysomela vigintipunctata]